MRARALAEILGRRRRPRRLGLVVASLVGLIHVWMVRRVIAARCLWREHRSLVDREAGKSTFLLLASHELRTPLALVRGYADVMASGTLGVVSQEGREALGIMDGKLREMEEMIQGMSETARIQSGRTLLRKDLLEVGQLIQDAADRVRPHANPKHRILLDLPRATVPLRADRARMLNVLANLIGNAVKYSPEGGEVRVTLQRHRRSIRILVRDEGIGIPREGMDRLFQPYSRLSQGAAAGISGMGIGLYLAREIALAHGGDLWAVANLDKGTTFVVSMPM